MEVSLEAFRKRYQYETPKDLIGKGGFSDVYKAWDTQDEQFVALKIATASAGEKYNLSNEVKKIKKLRHPNLIEYYEFYEVNTGTKDIHGNALNYHVAVMEYADGGTLADLLKTRPLTTPEVEDLAQGIIDGLAYLHANNITHRDLKPANILLSNTGGKRIPKITDFGIAKNSTAGYTASTLLVGTVEYMAPEFFKQTENQNTTPAADVWSLGVILLEALTGTHPFGKTSQGKTNEQIIYNILSADLSPALQNLHAPFKELITRCLIREANLRPQNAGELKGLLRESGDAFGERTQIISKPKPIKKEPRKIKVIIKRMALAICALLLIATGLFFFQKSRIENRELVPIYSSTGYYGFKDAKTGEIIIPLKYDYADSFYDGRAKVLIEGRFGFINKKGAVVVKPIYDDAHHFSEGLALIGIEKAGDILYGYIDNDGKVIIPVQYDDANDFFHQYAIVSKRQPDEPMGKYTLMGTTLDGVINKKGAEIIPLKYKSIRIEDKFIYISETMALYSNNGKEIIPFKYSYIGPYHNGLAIAWRNEKGGWINERGDEVIPCKYVKASGDFDEGYSVVTIDKKYFFINEKGITTPLKYDWIGDYSEGLYTAGYETSNCMGYIDQTGKEIIPVKYEYGGSFHDGIAPVQLNGQWGFIDKKGTPITPFIYDWAWSGTNCLQVQLNGKRGLLDKTGKEILPCIYDELDSPDEFGRIVAVKNGLHGIIDTVGNIIVPFEYENEGGFWAKHGLYNLKKNGMVGVRDFTGAIIIGFIDDAHSHIQIRDDQLIEEDVFRDNKASFYLFNRAGRMVKEWHLQP